MNSVLLEGQSDLLEEKGDVVDRIYEIDDEYHRELESQNPNPDRLVKLLNKQLMEGLKLQCYPMEF